MVTTEKDKKHRSPAYPFIPLRKAIERAKQLYDRNKRHPAPLSVAAGLWGYKEKSSGGLQTVSALKQFGLLGESGGSGADRQVRLTELALSILLDDIPGSVERTAAIKRAALTPKLFAEMFEKWGIELPTDETIRTYLKRDKEFNDDVVTGLIKDYKDTLAYANLSDSDKIPEADADGDDSTSAELGVKVQTQQQLVKQGILPIGDVEPVRIALEGGGIGRVIFSGSAPTPDDIEALIEVLKIQQRQMRKRPTPNESAS